MRVGIALGFMNPENYDNPSHRTDFTYKNTFVCLSVPFSNIQFSIAYFSATAGPICTKLGTLVDTFHGF